MNDGLAIPIVAAKLSHHEAFSVEDDVVEFPAFGHSKRQVADAGKALRGNLIWSPEQTEEHARLFRVAYDWRNSHAYPMRRIRQELAGRIRALKAEAITAARTKRMRSIRKKLARMPIQLTQIQDLGGCRAILESMADLNRLVEAYRGGASVHALKTDTSYIDNPRQGGYRSHHLVLHYQGTEDDRVFDGRRIEVQLRTRLQHAWATAVEAVGMLRGEDMKGGEGDADWLRLFALMSQEFAEIERTSSVPDAPERAERRMELAHLNARLSAAIRLEHLAHAVRAIETNITMRSKYYLLRYDRIAETVTVKGYSRAIDGSDQYVTAEQAGGTSDTVLVEVDKAENLRAAYPNYFGDVGLFIRRLNGALRKRDLSFLSHGAGGRVL